jgi:hypothetical protein
MHDVGAEPHDVGTVDMITQWSITHATITYIIPTVMLHYVRFFYVTMLV